MNVEKSLARKDSIQAPAEFLRSVFLQRKARNSSYSTRSFARDLGMSQSLLSRILNGKRTMTMKQAMQISVLLELPQVEAMRFIETAFISLPENSKGLRKLRKMRETPGPGPGGIHINYDIERFKMMSHWYHVALLDLTLTHGFRADPVWISKRLGVSPVEIRDALERLKLLGLLEESGRELKKTEQNVFFSTQRSEPAVRSFHQQMIGKAVAQLDQVSDASFSARKISSMTLTVPLDQIEEAKQEVESFQKAFAARFARKRGDEVYQLNIQLFPLTKPVETEKRSR